MDQLACSDFGCAAPKRHAAARLIDAVGRAPE
jgi:hypothetical protein